MLRGMTTALTPPAGGHTASQPAGGWWIALGVYFGVQLLSRLTVGEALELDEAEQVLWTQRLALGYGTQPPLYTWLQWALFEMFGVSLFALALLKNTLLALTYVFTFLAARTLMPASLAALASASMLLIPQIGWESQRDLTHSVVCTTAAAATLWLVLALRERATPARYVARGAAGGFGLLAKYSYAGFALALLVALAAAPDTRALLRQRWMAAAVAVAALVVLPHALWLATHLASATQGTLAKMGHAAALPWGAGVVRGLGRAALAVVAFLTPLWIVLAALFVRRGWRGGATPGAGCALLRRYLVAVALLMLALVLGGAATQFKDRWLQPYLFLAPLAFFACSPQLAEHPRLPHLRRILLAWALLLVVLVALRAPINGWRGKPDELNVPAQGLAQVLRDSGWDGGVLVAGDRTLAGVLRLQFPQAAVHVAGLAAAPHGAALWVSRGDDLAAVEAALGRTASAARTVALSPEWAPAAAAPLRYTFSVER